MAVEREAAGQEGVGEEGPSTTGRNEEGSNADGSVPGSASASFQACLELLKGPTDEKRLVGLLLAVKVMQTMASSGDSAESAREESIKAVAEAVGDRFIDRLLLPVSQGSQEAMDPVDDEEKETQCMLVAAAVAVLAVFCQVHELATEDAMLDRLPALMKVVGVGGARPIILGSAPVEETGVLQEEALVRDALECAVHVATCGSSTTTALLESGAMMAAAKVLERHSPLLHKLLAVRLVADMVAGAGIHRQVVLSESSAVLPSVVQGVGHLLGDSNLLDKRPGPTQTAVPGEKEGGGPVEGAVDAATLQLAALHTLELLLPLPEGDEAAEKLQQDEEATWSVSIQRGLNWVLRSKTAGTQRLAALQLTAAMVELRGAGWILNTADAGAGQMPDSFLQVLAETLWVELSLLLHDALHPERSTALNPPTVPEVAQMEEDLADFKLEEEDVSAEDVQEEGPSAPTDMTAEREREQEGEREGGMSHIQQASMDWVSLDPPRPQKVGTADLERAAASEQHIIEKQGEREKDQPAGERANQYLPACFRLVEALVEVLCEEQGEGEAGVSGRVREEVAERVMKMLGKMVDDLLQFMEASASKVGGAKDPLVLGATRALGAYYAQAPEAAGTVVQELLPFMMRVTTSSRSLDLCGPHFLLPMLLMCTTQVQPTEAQLDWRRLILEHHTDILSPLVTYTTQLAQTATRLRASAHASTSSTGGTTSTSGAANTRATCETGSTRATFETGSTSGTFGTGDASGTFGTGSTSSTGGTGGTGPAVSGRPWMDAFQTASTNMGLGTTQTGHCTAPPPPEALSLESTLSDACETLLSVIDKGATQQPKPSKSGREPHQAQDITAYGPVTQTLLPLVWDLSTWGKALGVTSETDSSTGEQLITQLCRAQLMPHVWVSTAAVTGLALHAVVRSKAYKGVREGEREGRADVMGSLVFDEVPAAVVSDALALLTSAVLSGAAALDCLAASQQGKDVSEEQLSWCEQFLEEQVENWERATGAATSIIEDSPVFARMCLVHLPYLQQLLKRSQTWDVEVVTLHLLVNTLTAIQA